MWKIIRENLGLIVAFAVLVLARTWKHVWRRFGKTVAFAATRFRVPPPYAVGDCGSRSSASNAYANNSVRHFRKRFFLGADLFVVQSAYVAAHLLASSRVSYFENANFAARVFRLFRRRVANTTSMSPAQRTVLEYDVETRTQNDADDDHHRQRDNDANDAKNASARQRTTTTNSTFGGDTRQVDRAYRKFGLELNANNDRDDDAAATVTKLGHLYRTTFDGGEPRKQRVQRSIQLAASRAQNGEYLRRRDGCQMAFSSTVAALLPSLRTTIKELVILMEAKANRKNVVDARAYGYRHAVNILAVCLFGLKIDRVTGSECDFYERFDELHRMWTQSEKMTIRRFVDTVMGGVGVRRAQKRADNVIDYFRSLVAQPLDSQRKEDDRCVLHSLVEKVFSVGDCRRQHLVESATTFALTFSICVVEILAGSFSLVMHQLSRDLEEQENIRDKDKVHFSLDGFPRFDAEFVGQTLCIDATIRETFKTFPIDPLIQLTCLRVYRIPKTKLRINPKSVVLIPANVLHTENNLYPSMDSFNHGVNQEMENEYGFITDSEMQSFFVFVQQFVDTCLRTTLTSLIQVYEFKSEAELNYEHGSSCRLSTLPTALPLRASRVEKRGKITVFEESLNAFHATKNVTFLSRIGL